MILSAVPNRQQSLLPQILAALLSLSHANAPLKFPHLQPLGLTSDARHCFASSSGARNRSIAQVLTKPIGPDLRSPSPSDSDQDRVSLDILLALPPLPLPSTPLLRDSPCSGPAHRDQTDSDDSDFSNDRHPDEAREEQDLASYSPRLDLDLDDIEASCSQSPRRPRPRIHFPGDFPPLTASTLPLAPLTESLRPAHSRRKPGPAASERNPKRRRHEGDGRAPGPGKRRAATTGTKKTVRFAAEAPSVRLFLKDDAPARVAEGDRFMEDRRDFHPRMHGAYAIALDERKMTPGDRAFLARLSECPDSRFLEWDLSL